MVVRVRKGFQVMRANAANVVQQSFVTRDGGRARRILWSCSAAQPFFPGKAQQHVGNLALDSWHPRCPGHLPCSLGSLFSLSFFFRRLPRLLVYGAFSICTGVVLRCWAQFVVFRHLGFPKCRAAASRECPQPAVTQRRGVTQTTEAAKHKRRNP